jgi:hypothetical protein
MIRNINLNKQFASTSNVATPFKPYDAPPKSAKIYLNSQDKMWGTNNDATFKVNLPTEFTTDNLNLTLNNFIPVYPTNTLSDIVAVDMVGVENPFSYSSSTDKTHRTLGVFPLKEGAPREYPPVSLTGTTTTLSNLPYGNGQYLLSHSGTPIGGNTQMIFNKGSNNWFSTPSNYNVNTGIYTGSTTTIVDGSNVLGEWVQVSLPSDIYLQSYTLQSESSSSGAPFKGSTSFVVAGSRNGVDFTMVDMESNVFWTSASNWAFNFPTNSINHFNTYRLITQVVGNSNQNNFRNFVNIAEWTLYGYSNPQAPTTTPPTQEYPPVAMTADTTVVSGQFYGNGSYTASLTSVDSSSAFQAFNKQYNGNIPRTSFNASNQYNSSSGVYEGINMTTISGSNYFGEHLTLTLPSPIVLQRYDYTSHGEFGNRCGNTWVVGGSLDGINWNLIDFRSNNFWTNSNETQTFNTSTNINAYNRYRMLTTRVGNSNVSSFKNDWGLGELRLFGYSNPPTSYNRITTTSTSFVPNPALAFDSNTAMSWNSIESYNPTTGVYIGANFTLVDGSNMTGEWVEMRSPERVILNNYSIAFENNENSMPSVCSMVASSNGTNYTRIHTLCNAFNVGNSSATVSNNLPTANSFDRFRFITHTAGVGGTTRSSASVANLKFTGYSNISGGGTIGYWFNAPPLAIEALVSQTFSGQVAGNGTYTIASSSGTANLAFDKAGSVFSSSTSYNATTGQYTGSTTTPVGSSNFAGEWVQIRVPYPITVAQLYMETNSTIGASKSPNTFSLVATNQATPQNFTNIFTLSNIDNWGAGGFWYKSVFQSVGDPNNSIGSSAFPTGYFQTWRLIVHRVGNSNVSSGRDNFSLTDMLVRGYNNNMLYDFPKYPMTSNSISYTSEDFGNGLYTVASSSNSNAPAVISTSLIPTTRIGQSNLNCEVITTDKSLFNRPITLQLKSLTGADLSTMGNWSAEVTVSETK